MRILDELGNELTSYDEKKGFLREDQIVIAHHKAVKEQAEQGHYEVIKEYPETGGKDVKWVVDVPAVEAREAYDETESILRYIPFTEKELALQKIGELKQKLFDTDYNILKIVEGAATLSECAEVIKKRAAWRKEINELERVTDG